MNEQINIAAVLAGDVITYIDDGEKFTGEVRAIEQAELDVWSLRVVLFRGGQVAWLRGEVDRFDSEAAAAWRDERRTAQRREELAQFFILLADKVRAGLPMPTYDRISMVYGVRNRDDLIEAAVAFGVKPEPRDDGTFLHNPVACGGNHNKVDFYCPRESDSEVTG